MSAPARKPHYWDHGTSEEGYAPEQGGAWLIDDFVSIAKYFPDWIAEEDGLAIRIEPLARYEDGGVGRIGFSCNGVSGEIALTLDPSGWVLAVATIADPEVFRGYVDRPWEQCEIWPPGREPVGDEEAPGRIGKKQTYVSLSDTEWPQLVGLTKGLGRIIFEVDEAKLRVTMAQREH